jgi:hypothetical protein
VAHIARLSEDVLAGIRCVTSRRSDELAEHVAIPAVGPDEEFTLPQLGESLTELPHLRDLGIQLAVYVAHFAERRVAQYRCAVRIGRPWNIVTDQELDELLVIPAAVHIQVERSVALVGQNGPEREAMFLDPARIGHIDRDSDVFDMTDDVGAVVAPEQGELPAVRAR